MVGCGPVVVFFCSGVDVLAVVVEGEADVVEGVEIVVVLGVEIVVVLGVEEVVVLGVDIVVVLGVEEVLVLGVDDEVEVEPPPQGTPQVSTLGRPPGPLGYSEYRHTCLHTGRHTQIN